MAMKRQAKFYRKNEKEVMEDLGMKQTFNSGSGWIEKSDGQNEHVICELKSTDATSIKVNKKDLNKLEYDAMNAHKIPVFAINFLETGEVYLIVKPDALSDAAKYIDTGIHSKDSEYRMGIDLSESEDISVLPVVGIKSSMNAREQFKLDNESKYKKEKSAK